MSARTSRGGFRPGRVAVIVAGLVAVSLALSALFERASFVDGLVLAVAVPLAVVATGRAIGLWTGAVPHTAITYAPRLMALSLDGAQAATPAAVIAFDGLLLGFAVLVTSGGEGPVTRPLMLGGGAVFIAFSLAWICVGAFRRPRFLLPATMRRPS